jgi:hypothetical protein
MGLLDLLDSGQAQLGLGLLAAAGPRSDGANFGQRMLEGVGHAQSWKQQQAKQKMYDLQMQEAQMKMEEYKRQQETAQRQRQWQSGLPGMMAPKYGAGQEGPTLGVDQAALQNYLLAPDSPYADKIMENKLFPKPQEAFTLSEGQTRFGPDGKPVAKGPAKPDGKPTKVQEYEYAKANGYKGTLEQYVSIGPALMAAASAPLRSAQTENIIAENAYNLPKPRPAPSAKPSAPMRGQVVQGYRFKGGNPADQSNWEKQ